MVPPATLQNPLPVHLRLSAARTMASVLYRLRFQTVSPSVRVEGLMLFGTVPSYRLIHGPLRWLLEAYLQLLSTRRLRDSRLRGPSPATSPGTPPFRLKI